MSHPASEAPPPASLDRPADPGPPAGLTYSWYVVVVLTLVFASNMADRQIVSILAQDIKAELGLSDTQIGLMTGPAIGLFYAVLGMPMARLADRVHRVRLLSICTAVWSAMTVMGGFAVNLWQLLLTRLGVSIAEAGATPTSISLIADYFPVERRGTPLAVVTAGSTLGVMMGLALGGMVAQAAGWRWGFFAAGAPGVILAILMMLTMREPARTANDNAQAADAGAQPPLIQVFRLLWSKPSFRRITYASCFVAFGIYGMMAWVPAYAVRSFGVNTAEVGWAIGLAAGISGGPMMIGAGLLIDRLAKHGPRTSVWMAALMMVGAASFFTLALAQSSFWMFVACFTIAYGMMVCYMPVSWTVILYDCPANMRSQATAILLLFVAVLSSVTAPLAIGAMSDILQSATGAPALQFALLLVPAMVLLAAIQFARTARSLSAPETPPEAALPA